MGRRTLQLPIFPATGGLQSANNIALVNPNNVADMDNIFFGSDLTRKTRPALVQFNSVETEVVNPQYIFDFWRLNAITGIPAQQVVRIVNGRFEADGGGDGAFADFTGSQVITPSDNVTSDVFAGLLMLAFESSVPMAYDHTSLTDLGGTPRQGSIIRSHGGYAWLAGINGDPHAVDRSYPGDPETWTGIGTETITVEDGDGDPDGITALFPSFYNDLYVAKRKALYRIRYSVDLDIFYNEIVLRGIGCVSHNSAVAVQNDILFVSERGVHSLVTTQKYGDSESTFLSAPVQDIFKKEVDFSRSKQINAVYIPEFNSYVLSLPIRGSSVNSDMLSYNILNGQWYRYRGIDAARLALFIDSKKRTRLMSLHRDCSVAFFDEDQKLDYGTDAIPSQFETGILYVQGAKRSVSFKSLTCFYVPQGNSTFEVSYAIDGQIIDTVTFDQNAGETTNLGPGFILGTSSLGQRGTVRIESKGLSGNGRGIQLTFRRNPSGDHIDQGMEILGYVIEFMDSEYSDEPSVQ